MYSANGTAWDGVGGFLTGPFAFNAVSFPDDQHGWAVGDHGSLWSTVKGGSSWTQSSEPGGYLRALSAPDASDVWVVGGTGQISRSTDAGTTWVQQTSGTIKTLAGVCFPDAMHGWTVGSGGTILATADGGDTWNPQASGTDADLRAVSFADDEHGVAVGCLGTVVATTDGGQTWTPEVSGVTAALNAVSCPDAKHAWAVGDFSSTASSDGYQSWKPRDDISNGFAVSFPDATHGWVVGGFGIWATTDGGETWSLQCQHAAGPFYGVSAPDADHCWVVGADAILTFAQVTLDTTPPAGTMQIDGGAAVTASTTATVDSAVTDANGLAFMKLSADGATEGLWQKYAPTATVTLPAGSGLKTVVGEYEDSAGNVTTLNGTITLSSDAPTVTVSGAKNGAWLSHATTLDFAATASTLSGGVASITLALDGTVSTHTGSQASLPIPVNAQRHAHGDLSRDRRPGAVRRRPDDHRPCRHGRPHHAGQGRSRSRPSISGAEVPHQGQSQPDRGRGQSHGPLARQGGQGAEAAGPESRAPGTRSSGRRPPRPGTPTWSLPPTSPATGKPVPRRVSSQRGSKARAP